MNRSLNEVRGRMASVAKIGGAMAMLTLILGAAASASDPAPASKDVMQPTKTRHWFEIGEASWYGLHFQGHKTATGEAFDMNRLTCAHRSLPLGSWIRVTNLRNRKSVFVRVNDRGPVPEDRIVDLSYAAAQAVGLADRGVGKVKVEPVKPGDVQMQKALLAQMQFPTVPRMGE